MVYFFRQTLLLLLILLSANGIQAAATAVSRQTTEIATRPQATASPNQQPATDAPIQPQATAPRNRQHAADAPNQQQSTAAPNQPQAAGDDLNGIWRGTLTQGPGGCYPNYFLEIQINFQNDQITGKAYDYYDKEHYVKMNFTGRYNQQTRRLVLIENKILNAEIPADCAPCIKTYDLNYAKKGEEETLAGDWKGLIAGLRATCPPGKILLKKVASSEFPVDIDQNDSLAELQHSLHLQPRSTELLKTISVNTPAIKIELYDNAEIDHDTVTVLINGKLLLYRQMLTDKPLTVNFNAFPGVEYELLMYADNLGTIPPNTALMMVTAGDRKIEIHLSSTEEKTAAVKFIYTPPANR